MDTQVVRSKLMEYWSDNPCSKLQLSREIGFRPETLDNFITQNKAINIKTILMVDKFLRDKQKEINVNA